MSVGRTSFVPTLPFVLSPDDPPGGGAPAALAPAAPAAPAAPPVVAAPPIVPAQAPPGPAPTLAGGGAPAPAAPAATPPAGGPATLAGGAPPETKALVPADFPADWREKMAGDDKVLLEQLKRHETPATVAKSWREISAKVSSGELKAPVKPLAKDATPEAVTAWRKEQGLPENPEAYVSSLKLPDGVVPGEADKPLLNSFAESAMKANWSADQYNQAVGWYYGMQDKLVAERAQADADFMQEAAIELTREWGPEFKVNQTAVSSFLDAKFPKDFSAALLNARLPNGNMAGNDPMFNRTLLALAKEFNPASTLLPAGSSASIGDVGGELATIEKNMKAPPGTPEYNSYWHGESGVRMQERYRQLIAARETMKGRAA